MESAQRRAAAELEDKLATALAARIGEAKARLIQEHEQLCKVGYVETLLLALTVSRCCRTFAPWATVPNVMQARRMPNIHTSYASQEMPTKMNSSVLWISGSA